MTAATKLFLTFSTLAFLIVGAIGTTFADEDVSSDVRNGPPFLMAQDDIDDGPVPYFLADRGEAMLGVCVPFLAPGGALAVSGLSRPGCGVALKAPVSSE